MGEERKTALDLEEVTGSIIGAAIDVHRALGPGFLEAIYENALSVEFQLRGIAFERQRSVPVYYRGVVVGSHRLDLLVMGQVVVELKSLKTLESLHFAIVRSYLHATNLQHGLILNFAHQTLEMKRVIAKQ